MSTFQSSLIPAKPMQNLAGDELILALSIAARVSKRYCGQFALINKDDLKQVALEAITIDRQNGCEGEPGRWYTIARYAVIDELRKLNPAREYDQTPIEPYHLFADMVTPEMSGLTSRLKIALKTLPSAEIKAITSCVMWGVPTAEFAEREGVKQAVVQSTIRRGLENLRNKI